MDIHMIIGPPIGTGQIGTGCCLPPPRIPQFVETIAPVGPLLNFTGLI